MKKVTLSFKNQILFFLFSVVVAVSGYAQNVVWTGALSGNGATLKSAFDAIIAGGGSGTVNVTIQGNTTEAASAVLSQTSYVVNIGVSGTRSVTGAITGVLVDLNGADNVTIDGGTTLTFNNTAIGVGAITIRLYNDAEKNVIKNCTILTGGQGTISSLTSLGAGITFGSVTTVGNRFNRISGCKIGPTNTAAIGNLPFCGITSYGSTGATGTPYNTTDTIENCEIYDIYNGSGSGNCWGIHLNNRSTDFVVRGNSFYQTATRASATQYYGIYVNNSGGTTSGNFTITGNYIGGSNATATGTVTDMGTGTSRFFGIALNQVAAGAASTIQGNTIQHIKLTSTSGITTAPGIFSGIALLSGVANIGNVTPNTIGASSYPISVTGSTAAYVYGIYALESSTPSVGVNNNVVSYITATSGTATVGHQVFGIQVAGVGSTTVNNNTVANLTTGTSGTTTATTGMNLWGINSIATGAPVITNNKINNLNLYTSGGSSTGTILLLRGIEATSGGSTSISNNNVNTLTSGAGQTSSGTGVSASIIGILQANTTGPINVNSDTIYNLVNSNSGSGSYSVTGIYLANATSTQNCTKNIIHSLKSTNTNSSSITPTSNIGIRVAGGTYNVSNNMVRLGIDASGASVSGDYMIKGIDATSGSTAVNFNSVYTGGSASSTNNNTFAIDAGTSLVTSLKNNIGVNNRTGTLANKHVGIKFSSSMTNTLMTNNLVLADVGNGGALAQGSTFYTDLPTLFATGYNANGVSSNPQFNNATGNSGVVDLHIATGTGTEVEAGAVTLAANPDDVDGNTRCPGGGCPNGTSSLPDIGADEGDFISADITPPVIATPSIANQSTNSAPASFTLSITDTKAGVNTTSGTRPRLYYKKCTDANQIVGNTSSDNGWKWVEATAATTYDFAINYSILNGGSASSGNIIQYFVVAQDKASTPNVAISNSLTFASTPSSVALTTANLPTGTLPNYVHLMTTGTFTVGTSGAFTSLTKECGCFQAINASAATLTAGGITLSVTSNLTEDNTYQLNTSGTSQVSTVTIQPSAASLRTISGTVADPSTASSSTSFQMVGVTGTGKLKIDGRSGGGGRYLLFRNTNSTPANTAPTLGMRNLSSPGATLDVNYTILEGNNQLYTGSTFGAHIINVFTANAGTNVVKVDSCIIRNATGGTTGNASGGIYVNSSIAGTTITNNLIDNIYSNPIQVITASTTSITGNSIFASASPLTTTALFYGINIGNNNGGPYAVNNNYIGGSAANCRGGL